MGIEVDNRHGVVSVGEGGGHFVHDRMAERVGIGVGEDDKNLHGLASQVQGMCPGNEQSMVHPLGFEPRTNGLRVHCSAIELEVRNAKKQCRSTNTSAEVSDRPLDWLTSDFVYFG